MIKEFWFDLDGTIADLYGVSEWREKLSKSDASPYEVAKPLVNMARLAKALHKAQKNGYTINVVTWLAPNSTTEYENAVTSAKTEWLAKHLPSVKWDKIKIVKYGTPKSTIGKGILFDDEERNRQEWGEGAFEPSEIFTKLATA